MEKETYSDNEKLSLIGYAQADFATLIAAKKLYIDRTSFIRTMERESNTNLMFVRPRRFGKSLWMSVLNYYYGVQYKDQFETLFGQFSIGQRPTPLRNTYLVLTFQFAGIDVKTEASTFYGFRQNVKTGILDCMKAYPNYFSEDERNQVEVLEAPANMIQTFFSLYKGKNIPHKLYILIDEYDLRVLGANEIESLNPKCFSSTVGGMSFVSKFYEMIKFAANNGIMGRFFATSVLPLTFDSSSSGFNILTNLSFDIDFHDLMGFRQSEVMSILQQVGVTEADIPTFITDLNQLYGGYFV